MAVIEIAKIQVRRGQELQTGIPQLDPGEFGWAEDTQHLYIGKRIIEGANTDENTRILTEPDLENIFNLINSTSSNILKYQYRDQISYIQDTVVRTVSDKLDDGSPSLCDFGVITSSTAVDISLQFQDAVDNIFGNLTASSFERKDARRVLRIPAGEYFVSSAIKLPPYTILQGEGTGLTRITVINSSTGIFKTVDADKDDWNTGNMDSGVDRARNVEIRGMTLEYAVTATSNNPLISLDNVLNAVIEDIEFRTAIDTASTTTYGLVSHGIGLSIRGSGGGIGAGDANLCENIQIRNSRFDSLLTGIEGTGTIVRPLIANSIFNNLDTGVKLLSIDSTLGPSNGYILENRFQNIVKEGIFVGTQTNSSNHISENNFFIQVGNGLTLDDTTTTTASSIITFLSPGNKSINDHFERKTTADTTVNPNFHYNPLVSGYVLIINDTVYYKSTVPGKQAISKLALVDADQSIDVNYKLYKTDHSYTRTGKLLINISSATTSTVVSGSISDYYNFSYADEWIYGDPDDAVFDITTSTKGFAQLNFTNWSGENLNIEYQINKTA